MSAARIPQTNASGWRVHAFALAGYLVATLAYFASALPTLGNAFPGGPVAATDGWQHVWHLWWAERALAHGANPFQMPLLYIPDGVNLAVHPLNLSNGLLVAPVTALAGPVAGFNLALLIAFTLTGLGGYLLALRVGARAAPAFVAGLLCTFAPFHGTKAFDGQLELVTLQWLVFYVWLLLIAAEEDGWVIPALAGGLLALVGYTSLYYLVYGALYSLLFVALWLPARSGRRTLIYLSRMLIVPIVATLALAPLLLNLSQGVTQVTGGALVGGASPSDLLRGRSANLVDFWLPSYLHPLWGAAVARLGPLLHPDVSAWNHALGYTALGLAAVACVTLWAHSWRWLVIGAAGLLLALGPELLIGSIRTGVPMPYSLLLLVPGMDIAQRPGHLVVLTVLALTPLAGLGLSRLTERFGRTSVVVVALLAAVELAPPAWPLQPFTVPSIYTQLAVHPGALMVLPINIDSSEVLRDQIVHGRPLVGGYLARTPPYPFAELTPGVRQLWRLAPDDATLADPAGATAAEVLAAYGIGDVVVRWERIAPERRAAAKAALAQALPNVAPSYADGSLAVYHVPPANATPFVFFGRGWSPEERSGDRRWRWMSASGELTLMNPGATPAPVALHLRAESYGRPRVATLRFGGAPAGTWAISAQPVASTRSLHLLLPPGASHLSVEAPAEADPGRREPISLSVSAVQLEVVP